MSSSYLNVDVLMCGHVHDFSIINSFNHKHSLLTLVTGIGWGSKEPDDGAEIHRYSLYTINLCMEAVESLKECFSPGTVLRAHFRWHSFSKSKGKVLCDEYQMLSQYSNLPDDQKSNSMQVVKWGGLIEHAFITGEPIVYSANKRYNPIQTSWDDFITMIPRFSDYSHDVRLSRGVLTSRPVMTFGLSVKKILSRDDAIALYLLAYLRFDEILTHVIDEYIRMFNIDVKKFLPHIEKIKNTYT